MRREGRRSRRTPRALAAVARTPRSRVPSERRRTPHGGRVRRVPAAARPRRASRRGHCGLAEIRDEDVCITGGADPASELAEFSTDRLCTLVGDGRLRRTQDAAFGGSRRGARGAPRGPRRHRPRVRVGGSLLPAPETLPEGLHSPPDRRGSGRGGSVCSRSRANRPAGGPCCSGSASASPARRSRARSVPCWRSGAGCSARSR